MAFVLGKKYSDGFVEWNGPFDTEPVHLMPDQLYNDDDAKFKVILNSAKLALGKTIGVSQVRAVMTADQAFGKKAFDALTGLPDVYNKDDPVRGWSNSYRQCSRHKNSTLQCILWRH